MAHTDDFYGGNIGAPSMSWDDKHNKGCFINVWRGGLVLSVRKKQATNAKDGKPQFWPDGQGGFTDRPIQCLIMTVLTNEHDPGDPVDDGARCIYVDQENTKYSKNNKQFPGQDKPGTKYGAHCDAMVAAGRPRTLPEPGGYYYLCQTGAVEGAGDIPRKTWMVNYQVPSPEGLAALDAYIAASGKGDGFAEGNGQSPQQAPFVNQQQPTSAPPPPPQGGAPQSVPSQTPAAPVGGQSNGQQPHWNGGQQQPSAPPQQVPPVAATPPPPNGGQPYQGQPATAPPQHVPSNQAPVQNGYAQQPQPVLLGYDANGQPIYGQPVQQAPANGAVNPHAYQGAPPQQPAPVGVNPYQQ